MRCFARALLPAILLSAVCASASHGGSNRVLVGDKIPSRLAVESRHIFAGSDSLYLGNRLLNRDSDYTFVGGEGYFDLSNLKAKTFDTLRVSYTVVPLWLNNWYGRPFPEVTVSQSPKRIPGPETRQQSLVSRARLEEDKISLSGAKSFRFSSRSAGASSFSQSLDLTISGELSPGLELTGTVSDRGISPAYGTANSRLNEFDRLNMTLKSRRLTAQIGDVVISQRHYATSGKTISGAALALDYSSWQASGVLARPRGRFLTARFFGRDGFQGPYTIVDGVTTRAIVPGSESIWLDGKKLERGNHKGYTIDYPNGRVTFSTEHLIDERSRIEVDFEQQATNYKEELFAFGAGGQTLDSSFYISASVVREGDDKNQPLLGELSSLDRSLLESAGDSAATRSGIILDSSGAYVLVVDSLPDSVFSFVGGDNGDYRITFSFVGDGKGDYRFLGIDRYEFAGIGSGDYLPVLILPAAERVEMYRTTIGWRPSNNGELLFDIRSSRRDLNLLSALGDEDNIGMFYSASFRQSWSGNGGVNNVRGRLRYREAEFFSRSRLDRADFARQYHLPERFVQTSAERLYEASGLVNINEHLSLEPTVGFIDYTGSYQADAAGLGANLSLSDRVRLAAGWNGLSSNFRSATLSGDGEVSRFHGQLDISPRNDLSLSGSFVHDRRENEYFGAAQGTRFSRLRLDARRLGESIRYELFIEDSLSNGWNRSLRRNRLLAGSQRRLGRLDYDASVSYQWLRNLQINESSLLGRSNIRYVNSPKKLSLSASYTISEEQRNARGIRFLEVNPGEGDFRFEDGKFIPDPDGDFIQVEELLSDVARVRRGERSFRLSKDFGPALVRFLSDVNEELLENGRRTLWWVIPFLTDSDQPFLFYDRRYSAELRLLPWGSFYAVNVQVSEELEQRIVTGTNRQRLNRQGRLTLKQQAASRNFFEERIELFESNRDLFFPGAGSIDGFKLSASYRLVYGSGELSTGTSLRRADEASGGRSIIYALSLGTRLRVVKRGELRGDIELYSQRLTSVVGLPSFQLTDNRGGSRGAIWSMSLNYGVKGGGRVNFTVSGRHSDDRTARVTARGEVIATF